ncbi:MAG: zinc metalloprotease HtpX [Armatimonadetes bacterium]|nr:zinc metalloprotease HtpX [Armatimonadota bacterium]
MSTVKVAFLLTLLTGLLVWLGNLFGGTGGMVAALGIAAVLNLGSYWFSDKIVLRMTRAEPVDEAQAPELYRMVARLSERAAVPMPRLYVVPDRSPNAFATGRNPANGVVAVNQGLLDILDRTEVEGVIAHEIAHIKHRDTLTMAVVATVAGAVMVIADIMRFSAFFGFGRDDDEANPVAMLAMAFVAPIAAMLIQMGVSRAREYEADRLGAELAGTGRGLQNALMKLHNGVLQEPGHMPAQAAHLCIVNPFSGLKGLVSLFSTHPPVDERIRRLEALEPDLRRAA